MPARQGSDVRAAAECPDLAQLHQHILEPAAAQEIGDAVGDVALRHAVQRHRHAGPAKADPAGSSSTARQSTRARVAASAASLGPAGSAAGSAKWPA